MLHNKYLVFSVSLLQEKFVNHRYEYMHKALMLGDMNGLKSYAVCSRSHGLHWYQLKRRKKIKHNQLDLDFTHLAHV